MADGTHSKVKLNVRVTPSKKEEWKEALDDGQTLSSLVQTAVDKEIGDDYIPRQALEDLETSADVEVDLSEVNTELNGVNSKLSGLQQTVSGLQAQIDDLSTPGEEPEEREISDLAMDLAGHVPQFRDFPKDVHESVRSSDMETEYAITDILKFVRDEEPQHFVDGSAQKLAQYVEADIPRVRQALIYLETKTTEDIGSVIVEGTRHWYRGVPA
jgi:archaellum component FlaC